MRTGYYTGRDGHAHLQLFLRRRKWLEVEAPGIAAKTLIVRMPLFLPSEETPTLNETNAIC